MERGQCARLQYNGGVDSWSVGFGEGDLERYVGLEGGRCWTPVPRGGRASSPRQGRGDVMRVRVVSDYICPWCYIGSARAQRLAQELGLELEPWPYELMPHLPPDGLPREVALGRRYPEAHNLRLQMEAASEGLPFVPPVWMPNTRLAHEAVQFAMEVGKGWPMHRALYEAYWGRGEDIGRLEVVVAIAQGLGLDGAALARALEEGRYHRLVEEKQDWARGQGIAGVPTFLFGDSGFALVGAQDYDTFRRVAQRFLQMSKG